MCKAAVPLTKATALAARISSSYFFKLGNKLANVRYKGSVDTLAQILLFIAKKRGACKGTGTSPG